MTTSDERAARRGAHVLVDARKAFDGGIGRHVREIVRRLPGELPRWRFSLLVQPDEGEKLAAHGLEPGPFAFVDEPATQYGIAQMRSLRAVARRLGADLFHAPHYVLPPAMPCPSLVTIHDVIHLKRPATPLHRLYARTVMRSACRQARTVLTVSEASARDLETWLGVPRSRIAVVPNGVEIPAAPPRPQGGGRRYVLYVGSLKPHKNVETLVASFRRLTPASGPELWLAGQWKNEERHRRRLEQQVASAGLSRRVRFLGGFPESAQSALLGEAALLAAPAWEEGFGLPPLEALAHGTPVVASRRGAQPEVLGDAAVYVDGGDPEELARVIDAVAGWSTPERLARAALGRARALAFSWDAAARHTAEVYRAAINP